MDVGVAGVPEVGEEVGGELFCEWSGGVAEEVEGIAEGFAPELVPAGFTSVASAVGAPAFDAVDAGPGGIFGDFGLPLGWKFAEEFAVVGEFGEFFFFDPVHRVGEGHLAVFVVVAIAFAVGGDVDELGGCGGVGGEALDEAGGEDFAGVEEALEGDGTGGGAVVEEDRDAAAVVEGDEVGVSGVDGGVGGVGPGELGGSGGDGADAGALVGCEDGELDAFLGEDVEDFAVDGGLGEPHAFGFAPEAVFEVGNAPADLGAGVAWGGEGHDDVVVDLGDGGAVAGVAEAAGFVGIEDHAVGAGGVVVEPTEQGGAKVEAHAGVVVDDADDDVLLVDDAGGSVGGVALGGDAVVPVVVGGGGLLDFDGFEPGVFARRLVEVSVDTDVALGRGRRCRVGGGDLEHARTCLRHRSDVRVSRAEGMWMARRSYGGGGSLSGVGEFAGGEVAGAPEIPGGDGAPGLPAFGSGTDEVGFGEVERGDFVVGLELAEGEGEAFADAVVVDGEDVGPAEAEEEHHLDGPFADAANLGEVGDDVVVGHATDAGEGGDGAVEGFGGEVAEGEGFVVGEASGAELVVGAVEQVLGREVGIGAAEWVEGFEQAAVDGGGGLAMELLVDDGFGEGFEGGLGGGELHGEGARAVDELAEFGVGGGKLGEREGDIVAGRAGAGVGSRHGDEGTAAGGGLRGILGCSIRGIWEWLGSGIRGWKYD